MAAAVRRSTAVVAAWAPMRPSSSRKTDGEGIPARLRERMG